MKNLSQQLPCGKNKIVDFKVMWAHCATHYFKNTQKTKQKQTNNNKKHKKQQHNNSNNNNKIEEEKREEKKCASTGNRTRVTRVAGEYSTTRPPMLR